VYSSNYFGGDIHPLEVVFIKPQRYTDHRLINLYTNWTLEATRCYHSYRSTTGGLVDGDKIY
jgi:hypothetical protein